MCTVEVMKRTRWIVSELRGAVLVPEVEVIESTGGFFAGLSSHDLLHMYGVKLRIMEYPYMLSDKTAPCTISLGRLNARV